ncbi:DUF5709 domain-containing protein [Streptomyces sp. NPDC018031]|uniref:DUF5709 domain-containing protein n=1 Tax=Streptomyces sp. NPDC018031 TaxID=3365033 RepID=UPI0037974E6D
MSGDGTAGDGMADDVYQPTGTNEEQEDASPLDPQDTLDERGYDERLDEGWSPPEKPLGVGKRGTTAAEQREGETLDQRLAQEVPDTTADEGDGVGDLPGGAGEPIDAEAGEERAGRLVARERGARGDAVQDGLATDVGIDGGAAGAEEAAVHVVPDPEEPPTGRAGDEGGRR